MFPVGYRTPDVLWAMAFGQRVLFSDISRNRE